MSHRLIDGFADCCRPQETKATCRGQLTSGWPWSVVSLCTDRCYKCLAWQRHPRQCGVSNSYTMGFWVARGHMESTSSLL